MKALEEVKAKAKMDKKIMNGCDQSYSVATDGMQIQA